MTDRRPTVLVADNDAPRRAEICRVAALDHEVVTAGHDTEVAARLAEDPPDAVAVSVDLPPYGGLAACRMWRGQGFCLPVALVAAPGADVDELARVAGADRVVRVPADDADLRADLRALTKVGPEAVAFAARAVRRWRTELEEIVRIFAHDLRGPMAALDTSLACLSAPEIGAEDREFFVGSCRDASERLRQMIDNLDALGELQNGHGWELAPFDLRGELDSIIADLQPAFALRDIRLDATLDTEIAVLGDRVLSRVAVRNVLLDALEHSAPGGVVTLIASPRRLEIEDTGAPVPPAFDALARQTAGQCELKRRGARVSRGFGLTAAALAMERQSGRLSLEPAGERGLRAVATWSDPA